MGETDRRQVLKGVAAGLAAAAIPGTPEADVAKQACGCPVVHREYREHHCTVHDENGRRWDSYSEDEIVALYPAKFDIQTAETEWSCYCGRHEDDLMPVGTRCVWQKTSYEYDEWECDCAAEFRQKWLDAQTTDWYAMAHAAEPANE